MSAVLFTRAMIFDGSGTALFPGEVLVEGDRIVSVARGADQIARSGAREVDCAGATLMPGMVESHAHLSFPSSVGRVTTGMRHLPPEEHLLATAHNAKVTLDYGFTSAYSAGSLGKRFETALKKEIEGGYLPGPRLRASSIERAPQADVGLPQGDRADHGRGAEAVAAFIKESAADGCDTVKLLLSGDEGFSPGGSHQLTYTEAEAQAAGEAAREAGVWLACHAQANEAIKMGVRHGFRILYHLSHADEEALDMIEARKADIFVAPAIGLLYSRINEASGFGIDEAKAREMGAYSGMELQKVLYPKLRKRGVRVLPGGDYGFPYNPVGRNARDLKLFIDLFGFTSSEVLKAATQHGGELMGLDVGLVKRGYLADLLVVDGDPLDDVTILQDKDRLTAIMKGGAFHKAPTERVRVFA